MNAREILKISPIIPVVTIDDENKAVDLANALIDGGVNIIEITLRTKAGFKSIKNIAKNLPNMVVGAGTVLNKEAYKRVVDVGAKFAISPGFTDNLLSYATKTNIPLIVGVASASEIMRAMEYGLDTFKLFPANVVGGVEALKAFKGPFGDIKFCPTGGINVLNMKNYLALSNVLCVGGTWITPKELINNKEFEKISQICKEALKEL